MKNNCFIIKGLFSLSLLFIFMILINEYYIYSTLLETILVNLVTGCFVSIVISLIEYRNDLSDKVKFFHEETMFYYSKLYSIKNIIENNNFKEKEKCQSLKLRIQDILDRSLTKIPNIKFTFLCSKNKKNITLTKVIDEIYELTFGIDLLFDYELQKNKMKHLKDLKKLAIDQIEKIDKGMSILKIVNKADFQWEETKKFFSNNNYII